MGRTARQRQSDGAKGKRRGHSDLDFGGFDPGGLGNVAGDGADRHVNPVLSGRDLAKNGITASPA
jgi:hypothetical protein